MFDFIPYDQPPPEQGNDIGFSVPNPGYAEQLARYREALKLNPFIDDHVCESLEPRLTDSPERLIAADEICVATAEATLVVGYPFTGQYAATIAASTPAGFTRADLFRQIARVYAAMYEGATLAVAERVHNKCVESPRFGTAWHALEDLVVEEAVVETRSDGRVFVWIYLGS